MKWYPKMTEDEIANACPVCLGNCNSKSCLRLGAPIKELKNLNLKVSREEVWYSKFLLRALLPFLKLLDEEQMMEREREVRRKEWTNLRRSRKSKLGVRRGHRQGHFQSCIIYEHLKQEFMFTCYSCFGRLFSHCKKNPCSPGQI